MKRIDSSECRGNPSKSSFEWLRNSMISKLLIILCPIFLSGFAPSKLPEKKPKAKVTSPEDEYLKHLEGRVKKLIERLCKSREEYRKMCEEKKLECSPLPETPLCPNENNS